LSSYGLEAPQPVFPEPNTLAEAIRQLPEGNQWAIQRFDCTDNGLTIARALRAGTAVALSDGSYKDQFGTSAMIIEAENSSHNIIAVNVVPGNAEDQGSFRSELSGIFGLVIMVNVICKVHNITYGAIECGCDGQVVLNKLSNLENAIDLNGKQFDLLSATRSALLASPVNWSFRHVKGHQDEDLEAVLDRWAILNIQMDNLAKAYWQEQAPKPQPDLQLLEGEYWPVFLNGRKTQSSLCTTIYEDIYRKKLSIHWHKHDRMTPDQFRLVNWEACEQAMRRLKISRRHWVAKHTEGMCGVNKWLFKWKDRDTDECPRCSLPEDARHVWQCLAENTHPIRAAGMERLDNWMQSSLTSPDIRLVINTRLQQLFRQLPLAPFPSLSNDLQQALNVQDDIGWENFFEGCIAQEWEAIQSTHYQWCKSRKSSRRWTVSLIQKLWDISWDLWEHRIGIVHSKENETTLHNMAFVDREIRQQFVRGSSRLHQRDHHLFQGSVHDILDSSILHRRKWLNRVETARARAERRLTRTYSAERQVLRAWLQGSTPLDDP
jgi:hypothetical protein